MQHKDLVVSMSNTTKISGAAAFIACIAVLDSYIIIESTPGFDNMVLIDSGVFQMGSDKGLADESPAHEVSLDGFWIDKYEVSNADYTHFIDQTGYLTQSEKHGGLVFVAPDENLAMNLNSKNWWNLVVNANWRQPTGTKAATGDSVINSANHPVVQVNFADALSYCNWLEKELPTEAQFEFAARGGREGEMYSWGNSPLHHNGSVTNHWQENNHSDSPAVDGYAGTVPVGSFPPNDYDLYDISGNVWEWVSDWYHPNYYSMSERENPQGIQEGGQESSAGSNTIKEAMRSIRGGSFLCSDDYCSGFRVSARMPANPNSSTNHTGFRCVKNVKWTESLMRQLTLAQN